ncbi:MAG TPA: Fur family transcriptional regulator [Bdellovibrionota bacterium]|nr:Fur family transcriptional regulator [Bdellovibrionota bacterium]
MEKLHFTKTIQTFKDKLHVHGYKSTRQRNIILEIFAQINHSVSANEFYRKVKKRLPKIGFATVYRTLKLLENHGLASRFHLNDGLARYQPSFAKHKEAFFYCDQCSFLKKIDQRELEPWITDLSEKDQHLIHDYRIEIKGLCSSCKKTFV